MKTKKIFLAAVVIASLVTASFSTIFAGSQDNTTLKCYDEAMYKTCADSTDGSGSDGSGDSNGNGGIIPPIGH